MSAELADEISRVATTGAIVAFCALVAVASVIGAIALIREFWRPSRSLERAIEANLIKAKEARARERWGSSR